MGYADSSGRANVGIARSNGHLYGFSSLHIILLVPQFSYWKGGGGLGLMQVKEICGSKIVDINSIRGNIKKK